MTVTLGWWCTSSPRRALWVAPTAGWWPPLTVATRSGWWTAPSFGRRVRLVWAKRRYVCREALCPGASFTEQNASVAPPRGTLTTRAVSWAVRELRGGHASISGLARRLGVDWHTVWNAVRAHLEALEADPARFDGVTMLGVDDSPARYRSKREVPPACGTTSTRARVARGC
ncbi:Transposase and inactivated derivatives [Kytococcus sedentarius]|uniref:helix-turn-helix domain-containing protein n=1 Tax=Kytococcus sedentarius TaxID=1276 RepID=UPI000E0876D3|nr:helix-turn-helix domain-containing protein [Kytococcus sedentarius]STX13887.1 Transposase and inactivated derivatives [Kytococcus sedentarius]